MLQQHKTTEAPSLFSDFSAYGYLDITCKQSPVVQQTIQKYGDVPLADYLKNLKPDFRPSFQSRDDLADVIFRYAAPLLGESVARTASRNIQESPVVMTANHHGVDFFSQSVQGSLFFSLYKNNGKGLRATAPILSCGCVPLNNLTYPRGFLIYHVNNGHLDDIPKRFPVFSDKLKRGMVSTATAFNEEMVKRAQKRFDRMFHENKISASLAQPLHEILHDDYCDPTVMSFSKYSQQSVVLNSRIWERLFSDSTSPPKMINLELEKVVHMLLEYDLKNPESLAWCVMFDPVLRETLLKELDGAHVCWDLNKLAQRLNMDQLNSFERRASKKCGTHFFWGIDKTGRRIPLYLQTGGHNKELLRGIDDHGALWELPYTPQSILNALEENRLLPSLFTCFLVLAFARGVTCVGGYYQGEYLPKMQKGLMKALKKTGHYKNIAGCVENIKAHMYLSGMQVVMIRIKDDALIPAGPLEIIAGGGLTEGDLHQILSMTVRDAHLASLFETIPDIAPWVIETPDWKEHLASDCFRLLEDKVVIK
jgi:hypothetical protein